MSNSQVLLLYSLLLALAGTIQPQSRSTRKLALTRKPNIVLILTDDQDVELGSLNFMPKTLHAIRDKGAEFRHAYVTTPMCCPSRSSLLTGMYVHNHNVYTNNDNCSSTQWQATHETRSYATYLSNAGYRTGYFGKYLNKYNGSYIPPGWREWGGLIMNSKYYNYSINMNGKKIKHGFDYGKDYYSDLIANDSVAFLRQSKRNNAHKPVMLTMSFPAPHGPEDSAPQYANLFFNITTHHTPSYDYAPNLDKQWILQVTNKMQPIHKQFTDLLMTKRLQTLQSVDSAVERVIDELESLGELSNTYVIYTSDHGYHLGQFGLIKGKSFPFEFDVRVPFLVRGPGVEPGTVVDDLVLNIDLAPTFLDIAGVDTPTHMDGHSALPLFSRNKRKRLEWPDTFLIESSGRREGDSTKHKAVKLVPIETKSGVNLTVRSNLETDSVEDDWPYEDDDDDGEIDEEENLEDETDEFLSLQLNNQVAPLTASSRLDCDMHEEHSLPCHRDQKWYCQLEHGRWRKHKCKPQLFVNKRTYKKCACFTQNGLVYRKVPINVTQSNLTLDRVKRQDVSSTTQHKPANRQSLSTAPFQDLDACPFANCSAPFAFKNRRTWRQSRHFIDDEIQRLRRKLDKLKEIRRHLKHTRPENETAKHRHERKHSGMTMDANLTESANISVMTEGPQIESGTKLKVSSPEPSAGATEYCHCEPDDDDSSSLQKLSQAARDAKQRLKQERHKKRERRQRKKAKLDKECLSEKMNCFSHDNEHWRTPPTWRFGPFCFCMNANNNTYSCLRTINATHNFLYCQFTTGEVAYYNLRIDPFELQNRHNQLKLDERLHLQDQLAKLMSCRGKSCTKSTVAAANAQHKYRKRWKLPPDDYGKSSTGQFFYSTHSRKLPKGWRQRNYRLRPRDGYGIENK